MYPPQSNNVDFSHVNFIVKNWANPIEVLLPNIQKINILKIIDIDNFQDQIKGIEDEIDISESVFVHETTEEKMRGIKRSGFRLINEKDDIREKSIFAWTHYEDVGKFNRHCDNETDRKYAIILSYPRKDARVSSYETSARKRITGEITESTYRNNHVLSYPIYEKLIVDSSNIISHLNYNKDSLII